MKIKKKKKIQILNVVSDFCTYRFWPSIQRCFTAVFKGTLSARLRTRRPAVIFYAPKRPSVTKVVENHRYQLLTWKWSRLCGWPISRAPATSGLVTGPSGWRWEELRWDGAFGDLRALHVFRQMPRVSKNIAFLWRAWGGVHGWHA